MTYNSGVLLFGTFKSVYDSEGNAYKRDFFAEGKFLFSFMNVRERDKYKFDKELSSVIKIKIPYNRAIRANNILFLNNEHYMIDYIDYSDKDKKNIYLFISSYKDKRKNIVSIYKKEKSKSALIDDTETLIKRVFSTYETEVSFGKDGNVIKATFEFEYLKNLDFEKNNEALEDYYLSFENKKYHILSIKNVDNKDICFKLQGEAI